MVPGRCEVGDEATGADRPGREAADSEVSARCDEQQREPDRCRRRRRSGRRRCSSDDDGGHVAECPAAVTYRW